MFFSNIEDKRRIHWRILFPMQTTKGWHSVNTAAQNFNFFNHSFFSHATPVCKRTAGWLEKAALGMRDSLRRGSLQSLSMCAYLVRKLNHRFRKVWLPWGFLQFYEGSSWKAIQSVCCLWENWITVWGSFGLHLGLSSQERFSWWEPGPSEDRALETRKERALFRQKVAARPLDMGTLLSLRSH